MSTTATPSPGNQLWGIYYTDQEYARLMGDPLRTVVEAPTKRAAEEAAGKLGFESPWRTRSLPSKPNKRYGVLNRNEPSDNPPRASVHKESTSDHAHTNHSSTAHRHRSVEEARRTH